MIKTRQAIKRGHEMWCPFGRLSLQTYEGGVPKILPGGAFNRAIVVGKNGAPDIEYLSSRCKGPDCPFYRAGIRPWHWGTCSLGESDGGVIGISIVLSTIIVCATLWIIVWGM